MRPHDVMRSAEMLSRVAIGAKYAFMMGLPGEEKEDLLATLDLMQAIARIKPGLFIMLLQLFRPYPGCKLYEECVKEYNYVPARTIGEWERSLNLLTGFENIEKYTWIPDKKFIRTVLLYADLANLEMHALGAGRLQRAVVYLVKKMASFRISRRFWGLPLELSLIVFCRKLRRS